MQPVGATTDVLVVGAGPSGLMAAVCLARLGVPVVVVDAKEGPTRESRALALQARSMEIYDQLGLAGQVLEECQVAPRIVPGYRTRSFSPVSFAGAGRRLTPFPGMYVLEQSRNEAILGEAFAGLGGDLRWRHRLTGLRTSASPDRPVVATTQGPDGEVEIRARWCIGADGSSSAVRSLVGIPFDGTTNPLTFYVADALDVVGLAPDSLSMRISEDDFLLAFPMGGAGHYRLLGVVERAPGGRLEDHVRGRLRSEFDVRYSRSAWFSDYRVQHRLAARYRAGPVLLVGDAAHVHSPVGAQGMNTGLQDAHNLACLLADIAGGRAPGEALDRYEAERRPVARRVVRTTDRLFGTITSHGRVARFARGHVVPVVAPFAARLMPSLIGTERLFGYLSQTRIHYPGLGDEAGPGRAGVVGRRLPWTGENFAALRSLRWQVHRYGADGGAPPVAEALGIEARTFRRDPRRRLDPGLLYLVRPDGFVAAAADEDHAVTEFGRRLS